MATITSLPTTNTVSNSDLIIVEVNPNSTPNTKSITVSNFFKNITCNTVIVAGNATPANSTITITQGRIFYDNDYLYIAVANNTIKRVALSSF